jgi:hypothetical protein
MGGTDAAGKREYRLRPEVLSVLSASTRFSRWYSRATISRDVFEESPAASTATVKRMEVLGPRRSALVPNLDR